MTWSTNKTINNMINNVFYVKGGNFGGNGRETPSWWYSPVKIAGSVRLREKTVLMTAGERNGGSHAESTALRHGDVGCSRPIILQRFSV